MSKGGIVIIIALILIYGLYIFFKYWFYKDSYRVPVRTHNGQNIQSILIVGRTGHGKSTLANVLLGKEKFAEVSGSSSGTKRIQDENFEWNGIIIVLLIQSEQDRFTKEQVQAFQTLNRLISLTEVGSIGHYITIVCSNFVEFRDKQKCNSDIKNLLKENKNIAEVIKGCKVIHVDNPPLQYKGAREIRQFSREKLLNHLNGTATEKSNTDIDINKIVEELRNS